MRGVEAVRETALGRPKKFKDEPTSRLTVMVPQSLRSYLEALDPTSTTDAAIQVVEFHKDLDALLGDSLTELRMSAAANGQEYTLDKAETVARLVKLGLSFERKTKR